MRRPIAGAAPAGRLMRDIHVIHRLERQIFAFATRMNRSWSRGDRGGRPSLRTGGPLGGTRRGGRDRRTDLRRPAMSGAFGQTTGPAGKKRRKRYRSLARCGSKPFPRGGGGQSRTLERVPQEGPQTGGGGPVFGMQILEIGLAVPNKRKPELVRQDRGAVGLRAYKLTNTGRSFARRRGGWQQCRPLTLWGVAGRAALSVRS